MRDSLKEEFEVDGDILGPGTEEAKEAKFLGRTVRWTPAGIEWEGDQKVVQGFLEEFALEEGRVVKTPGVKTEEPTEEPPLMEANEASL